MSLDLFSWFTFLIDAFPGPNMPILFPHKHQRMISIHMDKSMLTDGMSTQPNTPTSPHNVTWTNANIITFTFTLPLSLPPTPPPLPPSFALLPLFLVFQARELVVPRLDPSIPMLKQDTTTPSKVCTSHAPLRNLTYILLPHTITLCDA